MNEPRLILFHKQSTSGRTRFLRHAYGGVCAFAPLPEDAELVLPGDESDMLISHPASLVRIAEQRLGLGTAALQPEPGFRFAVSTGDGEIEVYLASFASIDPPFALAESLGGAFVDLTQTRGMAKIELALLRLAYEQILG